MLIQVDFEFVRSNLENSAKFWNYERLENWIAEK